MYHSQYLRKRHKKADKQPVQEPICKGAKNPPVRPISWPEIYYSFDLAKKQQDFTSAGRIAVTGWNPSIFDKRYWRKDHID